MKAQLIVSIVIAVLALAAVGLLGVDMYYTVADHRKAEEAAAAAKKLEVDTKLLAEQVTNGIQQILDNDESMKNYHVQFQYDMTLFQVTNGGTEYRGMVTAKTPKGTDVPIEVTAYADSEHIMYEIDGASELRLKQTVSKEQPEVCANYSC